MIADLQSAYRAGQLTPIELVESIYDRINTFAERGVWISLVPIERTLEMARALCQRDPASLPLYGIPFAIKDNIDLARNKVPTLWNA